MTIESASLNISVKYFKASISVLFLMTRVVSGYESDKREY